MRTYALLWIDNAYRLIYKKEDSYDDWNVDQDIPPFTSKDMAQTMATALNNRM